MYAMCDKVVTSMDALLEFVGTVCRHGLKDGAMNRIALTGIHRAALMDAEAIA